MFVFLTQINFFIFVRIIHLLVAKLRAHQMHYADYKFRWAGARAWVQTGEGWGWGSMSLWGKAQKILQGSQALPLQASQVHADPHSSAGSPRGDLCLCD